MRKNTSELYLIRHGQTEGNIAKIYQGQIDTPLTEKGREQARLMGKRIKEIKPDAVYASDLGRAYDTARIATEGYECGITTDPGLRERHFGIFQGVTFKEASEKYPEMYAMYRGGDNPDYRIPESETYREFVTRVSTTLEKIAQNNYGKTAAIFTHGGVIGYFVAHLLEFTMKPGLRTMAIANGGFTRFEYSEYGFRLLSYGDTHHMDYS